MNMNGINFLRAGRTDRAGAGGVTGNRCPDGTRASLLPKPLARGAEAHGEQDASKSFLWYLNGDEAYDSWMKIRRK
jgi:hypothetical protein